MKKQLVITELKRLKEITLQSDFGSAFAETPEEALEIAGREVLDLAIELFEASEPRQIQDTKDTE